MLRLLLGTGVLLMAVGFGAAGWQYWQSLPAAAPDEPVAAAAAAPAPARQGWLISPAGGLVRQDDVRAYLAQERFVPGRSLTIRLQARLVDLLAEGEKLPAPAFLQVLADIRAPRVADRFCAVMLETAAADCAVHAARVVDGSIDPAQGTALFQLELAYRVKGGDDTLPDLAAHVLQSDVLGIELQPGAEGTASPQAALRALLAATSQACAAEDRGEACRPMQLALDWVPGQPVVARAAIAWLDPLPKGMFMVPPLGAATGG